MKKKNISLLIASTCLFSIVSFMPSNPNSTILMASTANKTSPTNPLDTVKSIEEAIKSNSSTIKLDSFDLPIERTGHQSRSIQRYYTDTEIIKVIVDMFNESGKVSGQIELFYNNNCLIGATDSFNYYEFDQDRLMKVFNKEGNEVTDLRGKYLTMKEDYFLNLSSTYKNISKNFGYNLSNQNYKSKDGKIKISYPTIKDYKGELLQDYMNQDIKNIVNKYINGTYSSLDVKYTINRRDSQYLSITFSGKGTLSTLNKEISIFDSITFDIGKSCNRITTDIFIKDNLALKFKLEEVYGKPLEYEGLKVFFDGNYATFYFMPLDDSASEFTKISIPLSELNGIVNFDFGSKTAS